MEAAAPRASPVLLAAKITGEIGALSEQHRDVHRELDRVGTLAQHIHRQLQKIPREADPDTLRPIAAVLGTTRELVEGLTGLRANRHGYFHSSWYGQQLSTMERRLGLLTTVLDSELTRGLGSPDDDEPTLHEIIADELAREFWRVAFGRNVVEVPAGQFFACVERMIDGDDWLDFACLSQALDPKRSGRVEISAFAEFVEQEGGFVRGLHKYASAPTAIYACGSNRMGECGQAALVQDHLAHPTLLKVLADRTVRQVDCDSGFSAAVLENGDLYTWGSNAYGKLGHGEGTAADDARGACGAPRLVSAFEGIPVRHISCGSTFMAAVTEDGRLFTWGGYSAHAVHSPTLGHDPNTPGLHMQRGPADTPYLSSPVHVTSFETPVSQVACGTEHAAAITVEGRMYCWGGGDRGRLGIGTEEDSHTPQLVAALAEKTICQASCGAFHTLALTTEGMAYAWGSGKDGKLGLGDVAYCPFFERDAAGQPFVSKPQLLSAMANVRLLQLSAGSAHSAAVSDDGAVYTFGCGKCGKLGHGGAGAEWLPKMVEAARGADASQVACGRDHTAVVTARGLLVWGHGERGRLGNGSSSGVEAKPIQIRGMRGRPLQVQCGRFHTLTICGEQEMTEHEFDALERMLEDRLGIREAEGKATMERYRTTTGKKRRRRRQVNRLGQEEYVSETETEQSELDLAPEIEDQIVLESDMYLEKMEECEELKEKMEEMEDAMRAMQLDLQKMQAEKKAQESGAQRQRMEMKSAAAKEAGPTGKKDISGPEEGSKVLKCGYLMKQSGGKKDKDGKMKRSVGSMRKTWERRWFTLVEGVDIDGDGIPDMGLFYYETEEAQKQGEKPLNHIDLDGVQVSTEPDKKTGETIMVLDSRFREIRIKDDPDDEEDIDIDDWVKPLEEIIAKAAQQDSAPRSPSALDAGSVGSDSLAGGLAPISEFAEPTGGLPADAQGLPGPPGAGESDLPGPPPKVDTSERLARARAERTAAKARASEGAA